jgi:hypothetical protein
MRKNFLRKVFMLLLTCILIFAGTPVLKADAAVSSNIPKIKYFTASSTNISRGETILLEWEVEDAVTVELLGMEKVSENMMPVGGSLKVKLTETTNFMLVATGETGYKVSTSLKVTVLEKPCITSFTATSEVVEKGTLVTLRWKTTNATGCMIVTDDGIELLNRPANGQISITPNETGIYKLVAYNGNDKDEKSIKIIVK